MHISKHSRLLCKYLSSLTAVVGGTGQYSNDCPIFLCLSRVLLNTMLDLLNEKASSN